MRQFFDLGFQFGRGHRKIDHPDAFGFMTVERIAKTAVIHCMTRQHRIGDYQFSYDKMLDLKGNTAIYLMYSYARICSIASKAGVKKTDLAALLDAPFKDCSRRWGPGTGVASAQRNKM